jgi:hypothetical protein
MNPATPSKWTAFLLSACVPGAGQLVARSWTCLAWFAVAVLLAVCGTFTARILNGASEWLLPLQMALGIGLCLLSAEHAKRLLERRGERNQSHAAMSHRCLSKSRGRKIDIEFSLDVTRSPDELWNLISDLPRFLTIDPFHDTVTLMRNQPAKGVDLVLSHNAFGVRFERFGRLLAWQEGRGYTFSDLSARGPRHGFPHVFMINLKPLAAKDSAEPRTRLTVHVRGRWTSRLTPACVGRLWVWLVCREHARLLAKGI